MNKKLSNYLNTLEKKIIHLTKTLELLDSHSLTECYLAKLRTYQDSMLLSKAIFSPADTVSPTLT